MCGMCLFVVQLTLNTGFCPRSSSHPGWLLLIIPNWISPLSNSHSARPSADFSITCISFFTTAPMHITVVAALASSTVLATTTVLADVTEVESLTSVTDDGRVLQEGLSLFARAVSLPPPFASLSSPFSLFAFQGCVDKDFTSSNGTHDFSYLCFYT